MLTAFYHVIVLALATTAISITCTKGSIFMPLRLWILARSRWLGKLVKCPYCFSHWVAFALVGIYCPILIPRWFIVDWFVTVFVVVALSAVVTGTILWLMPFQEDAPDSGIDPAVKRLQTALSVARKTIVDQRAHIEQLQQK